MIENEIKDIRKGMLYFFGIGLAGIAFILTGIVASVYIMFWLLSLIV